MLNNIILGGLIGSTLTVIVSKILDMIQEGKKHKYALQRVFFEKKLQTIEEAVKEWQSLASAISNLIVLYEQLLSKERDITSEVFDSVYNEISSRLKEFPSQYPKISDAILLYFDIEEEMWDTELFEKYLVCFSLISTSTRCIQALVDNYNKYKGTEQEELAFKSLDEAGKQHEESLKKANLLLKEVFKQNRRLIHHARTLMKKYESSKDERIQ